MKIGDRVTVFNHTTDGHAFIEGKATLVKKQTPSDERGYQTWMVQFDGFGDKTCYRRRVHPRHATI